VASAWVEMTMSDHTNNEWISIGDFMAGIVGVLVLFFVIAILISATAKAEAEEKKKQGIQTIMNSLGDELKAAGAQGLELLPEKGVMRLKGHQLCKR
jgi:chemotaxis protein MotB